VGHEGPGEPPDRGAHRRELGEMVQRELAEHRLSPRRELDEDPAPVDECATPPHELPLRQAVDQLDGAVVLHLKPLGQLADRRLPVPREALHGEQELMVLGLDTGGSGRLRAESEEPADLVAELGQGPVGARRHPPPGRFFVSFHDTNIARTRTPGRAGRATPRAWYTATAPEPRRVPARGST